MSKTLEDMKKSQESFVIVDGTPQSTPPSPTENSLTPTIGSVPGSKTASPNKKSGHTPPEIALPPSSGSVSPVTPPDVELKSVSDKVAGDAIVKHDVELKLMHAKYADELERQRHAFLKAHEDSMAKQNAQHVESVKEAIQKITSDLEKKHADELLSQKKMYEEQILKQSVAYKDQQEKMQAEINKRDAEISNREAEIKKRDADIKREIDATLEMKAAMINEKVSHESTQGRLAEEQAKYYAEQAKYYAEKNDHAETREKLAKTRETVEYSQRIIASHPIALDNYYKAGYSTGHAAGQSAGHEAGIAAEKDRMNGPGNL